MEVGLAYWAVSPSLSFEIEVYTLRDSVHQQNSADSSQEH